MITKLYIEQNPSRLKLLECNKASTDFGSGPGPAPHGSYRLIVNPDVEYARILRRSRHERDKTVRQPFFSYRKEGEKLKEDAYRYCKQKNERSKIGSFDNTPNYAQYT